MLPAYRLTMPTFPPAGPISAGLALRQLWQLCESGCLCAWAGL